MPVTGSGSVRELQRRNQPSMKMLRRHAPKKAMMAYVVKCGPEVRICREPPGTAFSTKPDGRIKPITIPTSQDNKFGFFRDFLGIFYWS